MIRGHSSTWLIALLLAVLLGLTGPATARELRVPTEYATIGAALLAAADGDTVLVGPGIYYERLYIERYLTLVSEDGPEATIIDGGGSTWYPVVAFTDVSSPHGHSSAIEGFTVQHGRTGVQASFAESVAFSARNCIVRENTYGLDLSQHVGAIVEQCTIVHNVGGGVLLGNDETPFPTIISRNVIAFNGDCGICGSGSIGGAEIEHNTIAHNGWDGIGVVRTDDASGTFLISSNVIAENGHYGLRIKNGLWYPNAHHNDIWSNAGGDVAPDCDGSGQIVGFNGNFSADPLFCDVAAEDFTFSTVSPCMGTGYGGTNVGALGIGCEPPGNVPEWEPRSWGTIKALFR